MEVLSDGDVARDVTSVLLHDFSVDQLEISSYLRRVFAWFVLGDSLRDFGLLSRLDRDR